MPLIETHGSATIHLTDDEFGTVREYVQAHGSSSELARIIADAHPAPEPKGVSIVEHREHPDPESRPLFPDGVDVVVGERLYTYALTPPIDDVELLTAALATIDQEAADVLEQYELPADPPAIPVSDATLILPG